MLDNRKRIVFTVTNDLTYDQRMQRICNTLSDHGYIITIIGRRLKKSLPLQSQKYHQYRVRCVFNKGKLFYLEYNMRLLFKLLSLKYDIICGVDLDTIIPCLITSRIKNKKCVYDAHEYFPEVPEVIKRPFVKAIWKMIEAIAVKNVHATYTVSESIAGIFSKNYDKTITVIRNFPLAVEQQVLQNEDNSEKYILYQGALNEGRGLEQAIGAMQKIDCKLYLVGEGDNSNQLKELAKQLNLLDTKVCFLGWVKPDKLITITAGATIGLNLLDNKSLSYYYSLSNKLFDYIQAEVPSINMAFPEYENINKQFEVAVLLKDLSIDKLVQAINNLLTDNKLYNKLKSNCLKARRVFIWEKEVDMLLNIYHQL